jgi:hypothetical protein
MLLLRAVLAQVQAQAQAQAGSVSATNWYLLLESPVHISRVVPVNSMFLQFSAPVFGFMSNGNLCIFTSSTPCRAGSLFLTWFSHVHLVSHKRYPDFSAPLCCYQ